MTTQTDDHRAMRNVAVLVAAQAILGAQLPILFVIGGLVGGMLAPNPCLATLPISMIVFSSMTTAPWLSPLMQRRGRQIGFYIGTAAGVLGGVFGILALLQGSFLLLLIGGYFSGIYQSAQGFFRFAATDTASDAFKPRAVSFVLAGGLLSALIGPQINKFAMDATSIPFLGSYVVVILLNLAGVFLIPLLDLPIPSAAPKTSATPHGRSRAELLRDPHIVTAIIVGMVSYALMNLVMTSTPIAIVGCGFTGANANDVVSAHVIAMFAPSFFTGYLIRMFGVRAIMLSGLAILAMAGLVALSGVTLTNFFIALILLGIGWNFGFIGATTLLATSHSPEERGVVQGINDMMVFGCVTVASVASGGLMNCSGGSPVEGWTAVNLAMVPFLLIAVGAIIYMSLSGKRRRA